MRLWTLHPKYLDPAGLVALWREALLAQAVLLGRTRGYTRHPQLIRFQAAADPAAVIAGYLAAVFQESLVRGYRFDGGKIQPAPAVAPIPETDGQVRYEWIHLLTKLAARSPQWHRRWEHLEAPDPHPLFRLVPGPVRAWERVSDGTAGSR